MTFSKEKVGMHASFVNNGSNHYDESSSYCSDGASVWDSESSVLPPSCARKMTFPGCSSENPPCSHDSNRIPYIFRKKCPRWFGCQRNSVCTFTELTSCCLDVPSRRSSKWSTESIGPAQEAKIWPQAWWGAEKFQESEKYRDIIEKRKIYNFSIWPR